MRTPLTILIVSSLVFILTTRSCINKPRSHNEQRDTTITIHQKYLENKSTKSSAWVDYYAFDTIKQCEIQIPRHIYFDSNNLNTEYKTKVSVWVELNDDSWLGDGWLFLIGLVSLVVAILTLHEVMELLGNKKY